MATSPAVRILLVASNTASMKGMGDIQKQAVQRNI
jgi:hypothetical protein